jgi:hypothetical protein
VAAGYGCNVTVDWRLDEQPVSYCSSVSSVCLSTFRSWLGSNRYVEMFYLLGMY